MGLSYNMIINHFLCVPTQNDNLATNGPSKWLVSKNS